MNQETRSGAEPSRKRGIWPAIAYFAGVAALVVGVYWAVPGSGSQPVETVSDPVETTTTTVAAVAIEAPTYLLGEEPIADAAEIILPSVVHIQTSSGLGSGVIYDSDGLIITAAHVVAGDDEVRIRFNDGEQVTGTVVGAVSDVDIAVIQVDRSDLPAAVFNTDSPRVGQLAIAVGSPWGLESTVTAGIISAIDQTNCRFDTCFSMVQTDAALNPGNSGGALVDRHGQVVGINVSIFTTSGTSDGVGFAVPSLIAMDYAESIVSGDPLETAFLGVQGDFVSEGQAGAVVTEVFADTSAEEAGIEIDDVIISFDGVAIQGIDDLAAQVRTHRPGDTVEIVLLRGGETVTVEVALGARTADLS